MKAVFLGAPLACSLAAPVLVSFVPIDEPRGAQDEEPRRLDLGARLGDEGLDELLAGERLVAVDLAAERALAHELEGALADADPAHAVVDAARTESLLRNGKAGALGTEAVLDGDAAVFATHFAVAGEALAGVAHDRDVADSDEAGGVRRHEDHRRALVRRRVGVGHGHGDGDRGPVGGRGGPLVPVDDVRVAVAHRAGAQLRGLLPGVSGTVMAKQLRISPRASGRRNFS